MAKYTADIEIAVRGAREVDGLIKNLNRLNNSINVVNRNAKVLEGKGFNVANMENYSRAVSKAERALRQAAQGTKQEEMAVRSLVSAMEIENKARTRRNFLIAQEVANRRKINATVNAGFGVQGPQAANIRTARGPASPIRGTANMPGSPAALATGSTSRGIGGRIGSTLSSGIIGGAFPLLFGQSGGAAAGGAIGGLVGGAFGGAGGFAGSLVGTVLGDIASRGQAVKQLADDIGFSAEQTKQLSDAFKVANTDVEKFTAVIQNIRGVGLEIADQAKAIQLVTRLTDLYGGSFEKTGNAITSALEAGKVTQATLNQLTSQGINIQQALADKLGISRDKILTLAKDGDISVQTLIDTLVTLGNSTTEVINKPVSAIDTLNQRFDILATRVSTSAAGINQTLTPAFIAIINATSEALKILDDYIAGLQALASAASQYISPIVNKFVEVKDAIAGAQFQLPSFVTAIAAWAREIVFALAPALRVLDFIRSKGSQQKRSAGATGLYGRYAAPEQQVPTLQSFTVPSQLASTGKGTKTPKGPKPPENRTAQLLEDLKAMERISKAQDDMRNALFEGNRATAIRLEYDQKVADINRDTAKALMNANYESEKTVIRAQEIVRLKDAQLVRDDELRELARDISEIITSTLDDLRGGVRWDDTGLRNIFDMNLPDAIKETQDSITKLVDPANQIIGAATAISEAFRNTFNGIATGAVTAREGLSNFFKSVGSYFIDMAATIAAEALKLQAITILQTLLSPLLNPFGVGAMTAPGLEGTGGAFAEGGFVTGPTRALIGEGGEPEYVIPASKMRGAMSRYSAGARGSGVIPSGSGDGATMGATMTAAPIDVRYTVERINSVDYVTADQFQAGMRQAASQGAERGQQLALRRLQQSPSARRRVGMA